MPKKIAQCLRCKKVRTIKAKGLCHSCYSVLHRKPKKILNRTCAYIPCSRPFQTTDKRKIYCSRKCKGKDYEDKYQYLKYVPRRKCPKCHGSFGELYKVTRSCPRKIKPKKKTNTYYRIQHFNMTFIRGSSSKSRPHGKEKRKKTYSCVFSQMPKI